MRKLKQNAAYGIIQMCNTEAQGAAYWFNEYLKDMANGDLGRAIFAQKSAANAYSMTMHFRRRCCA